MIDIYFIMLKQQQKSTLFPYTTLFRSQVREHAGDERARLLREAVLLVVEAVAVALRSEEHTSELQSHVNLVCRLLLEKKNIIKAGIAYKHAQVNNFY